jgi:hypothetical protein
MKRVRYACPALAHWPCDSLYFDKSIKRNHFFYTIKKINLIKE